MILAAKCNNWQISDTSTGTDTVDSSFGFMFISTSDGDYTAQRYDSPWVTVSGTQTESTAGSITSHLTTYSAYRNGQWLTTTDHSSSDPDGEDDDGDSDSGDPGEDADENVTRIQGGGYEDYSGTGSYHVDVSNGLVNSGFAGTQPVQGTFNENGSQLWSYDYTVTPTITADGDGDVTPSSTGTGTTSVTTSSHLDYSASGVVNWNLTSGSQEENSFQANADYDSSGSQDQTTTVTTDWSLDTAISSDWRTAKITANQTGGMTGLRDETLSSHEEDDDPNGVNPPTTTDNYVSFNDNFDYSYNNHLVVSPDANGNLIDNGSGSGNGSASANDDENGSFSQGGPTNSWENDYSDTFNDNWTQTFSGGIAYTPSTGVVNFDTPTGQYNGHDERTDKDYSNGALSYESDDTSSTHALLEYSDLQNRYLWGPDVDMLLVDENVNFETSWAVIDQQNSVRNLLHREDNVIVEWGNASEALDAFGVKPWDFADSSFVYDGRYYDTDIGLEWNGARWYNSSTGSWLSQDPLG